MSELVELVRRLRRHTPDDTPEARWADVVLRRSNDAGIPYEDDPVLPEGVHRVGGGRFVMEPGTIPPEGWETNTNVGLAWVSLKARWGGWAEVRPKPQPKTERVPHHEAVGRTIAELGVVTSYHGNSAQERWVMIGQRFQYADPDGTVEVLVEQDDASS